MVLGLDRQFVGYNAKEKLQGQQTKADLHSRRITRARAGADAFPVRHGSGEGEANAKPRVEKQIAPLRCENDKQNGRGQSKVQGMVNRADKVAVRAFRILVRLEFLSAIGNQCDSEI